MLKHEINPSVYKAQQLRKLLNRSMHWTIDQTKTAELLLSSLNICLLPTISDFETGEVGRNRGRPRGGAHAESVRCQGRQRQESEFFFLLLGWVINY